MHKTQKFQLAQAFKAFRAGLNLQKIELNNTSEGGKVLLYSTLGASIKDEQEALTVFKRGQNELRQSYD